jgi:hypothetical protein
MQLLDDWLCDLTEDDFIESLPLLRRSFSTFDAVARRRLMERVSKGAQESTHGGKPSAGTANEAFDRALPLLYQILGIAPDTGGLS